MRTSAMELRRAGHQLAFQVVIGVTLIVALLSMSPVNAGVALSTVMATGSLRAFVCCRLSRHRADKSFAWFYLPMILCSIWLALMGTFVVNR